MSVPISSTTSLAGRVAVVTGAASGIGKACCLTLAREKVTVVASDIAEWTDRAVDGDKISFFRCDVTQEEQVEALFKHAHDRFKRVDILVNSAGMVGTTPIDELSVSEWDMVMGVNVKGTFLCSKYAMRLMQERQSGKIICFGSISGKVGGVATGPHYVASKAAVHGLSKWLARNGGKNGINVNCIVPGHIRTPMLARLDLPSLDIPVGRIGEPEEIGELVVFLVSDASNFINGALININGGVYMDG